MNTAASSISTPLAIALRYRDEGLVVVPVRKGEKAPLIAKWQREPLQTEARVRELFAKHDGNVGIVCGSASRLLAVDVDVKREKVGAQSLEAWQAKHGELPATRTHSTPSGGIHLLFRLPEGKSVRTCHVMGPDIDVQAQNAQILAPGSVLIGVTDGRGRPQVPGAYAVEFDDPIADCPKALLDQLNEAQERGPAVAPTGWTPVAPNDPTYAERVEIQRKSFADAPIYLSGEGRGNVRYVMLAQRVGPGLRLDFETTMRAYAEVYDTRLPEGDRWLPECESELRSTIARAFERPMVTGYQPDQLWHDHLAIKELTPQPANDTTAPAPKPLRRFATVDATALAKPLPPVEYVMRYFGIAKGRPTLLAGYGGIGKTFIIQSLALNVAASTGTCWGQPVAKGRVLHIDYEMTIDPVQRRYQRIASGMGVDLSKCQLEVSSMPDVYLSDPDAEGALVEVCRGVTLAIVDNLLAACASATLKENESGIRRFLDILTRVTSKTGCAFVVLVHERKAGKDDQGGGLQRVRGSSAITDAAGSVISIGAAEGDGIVSAQQTKSSLRKKGDELLFQIEDVGEAAGDDEDSPGVRVQLVSDRPPSEHRAKLQAQIIELLSKGPQESKRTIENSIKGKRGQIGPEVDALVVRREVVFIKGKGYVLDCPVARRGRLVEASRIPGLSTPEKLAKAACVDVSDVHAMLKDGVLFKSGSGFVATLEAAL